MGAFLTLIVGIITFAFFYAKVLTIYEKHDVDIMTTSLEFGVEMTDKFSAKQGFFISAALTRYD